MKPEIQDSPILATMRVVLHIHVFALVLALYPYTSNPAGPVKQLAVDGATMLLAIIWLAQLIARRGVLVFSPLTALTTLFVAGHLMAALLSDYTGYGLVEVQRWTGLLLLYFYASQCIKTAGQMWSLTRTVIIAVACSSVYGLYQATGLFDPFPWSDRSIEEYRGLPSTYANPNFAAHTLVLALILAAGSIWRFPGLIIAGLLMAVHLYATHARGARIALLAAGTLAVFFLVARSRETRPVRIAARSIAYLALCVFSGAVLVMAGQAAMRERLLPVDSSLVLRYNGYYGAARMIQDRPVLGFGPGAYAQVNPAYWTDYEQRWYAETGRRNFHVHNDLLETAVDAGFPVAGLLLAIFVYAILRGLVLATEDDRERRRLGLTLAACFVAFVADGCFGFNLRVPVSSGLLFILLGGLAALTGTAGLGRKGSLVCGVLGVTIAAGSLAFGWQMFRVEQYLQKAEIARYYHNQQRGASAKTSARYLAEAYNVLGLAQKLAPWDTRFPLYMAFLDIQNKQYPAAIQRLAYAQDPECVDVQALTRLGRAHASLALEQVDGPAKDALKSCDSAERILDRVEALCPVLPELWELRANLGVVRARLAAKEDRPVTALWNDVAEDINRAILLGAKNRGPLQRMLGTAYMAAGDVDRAEDAWIRAVESAPEMAELWLDYHAFAQDQQRYDRFVAACRNAMDRLLHRSPVPAAAYANVAWHLAAAQRECGHAELARSILEEALARDPANLVLWGELTTVLPESERLAALAALAERARQQLGAAGMATPSELTLLIDLRAAETAELAAMPKRLLDLTQNEAAPPSADDVRRKQSWLGDLCVEALQRSPLPSGDLGPFLATLGDVFLLAERWQSADETLAAAAGLLKDRGRALALASRSEALAHLDRPVEALATAQEAAANARDSLLVTHMLARRLAENGRVAESRLEYRSLLQRIPDSSPTFAEAAKELSALERPANTGAVGDSR